MSDSDSHTDNTEFTQYSATPDETSDSSPRSYQSSVEKMTPVLYQLLADSDGLNVVEALLSIKAAIDKHTEVTKELVTAFRQRD